MSLTKVHIIERIYEEVGFSRRDAGKMVDSIFSIIKETLVKGEKVKISGFGNFSVRDKAARMGRNPQTGEVMEIRARRVLTFRASPVLREDITARYAHRLKDSGEEDTSLPPKEGISHALSSFMSDLEEKEE